LQQVASLPAKLAVQNCLPILNGIKAIEPDLR
jgi:hypothetical protein